MKHNPHKAPGVRIPNRVQPKGAFLLEEEFKNKIRIDEKEVEEEANALTHIAEEKLHWYEPKIEEPVHTFVTYKEYALRLNRFSLFKQNSKELQNEKKNQLKNQKNEDIEDKEY